MFGAAKTTDLIEKITWEHQTTNLKYRVSRLYPANFVTKSD